MIETAARGAQFLLAIGIAYIIALWFAMAAWTFRDIEARSRSVFTQVFSTLLVVLFFIPGLLLYLILRPKETLDQAFQRALEEEYLLQDLDDLPLCPGCQRAVDADFVICPHCQTRLRGPCPACSRLIDLRWTICPYCAVPTNATALEAPSPGIDTVRVLAEPRSERRRRAMTAAAQRVGIETEELDALSEALSGATNHAAVGAGDGSSGNPGRVGAFGDFSRVRDEVRARFGSLGSRAEDAAAVTAADSGTSDAEPLAEEDGFWADPLPGSERGRGRKPPVGS